MIIRSTFGPFPRNDLSVKFAVKLTCLLLMTQTYTVHVCVLVVDYKYHHKLLVELVLGRIRSPGIFVSKRGKIAKTSNLTSCNNCSLP